MLKIRLARGGSKHKPRYRIVVAEARSKRDGKVVASIGHWHPNQKELSIEREAYKTWLKKGAVPTQAVLKLTNEKTS